MKEHEKFGIIKNKMSKILCLRAAEGKMVKMLMDYHIHTNYSDDCNYPMEEVVKDAISMGAKEICFTDHVDYGIKTDWNSGETDRRNFKNSDWGWKGN